MKWSTSFQRMTTAPPSTPKPEHQAKTLTKTLN